MASKIYGELTLSAQEIAAKRRYIDDQTALLDVLEHDGHDVVEQRKALAKERSNLAVRMAQHFQLLDKIASKELSTHD